MYIEAAQTREVIGRGVVPVTGGCGSSHKGYELFNIASNFEVKSGRPTKTNLYPEAS